jgi:2-C-methyl-D-erythritol 2,4-cyclodiphosphate synthase
VTVDSDVGAEGHSDADALTHAVTDAILGALALGDIGSHFPNTDERWANAESFVFLRFAVGLMKQHGYSVANVDATVELEQPKLRPHIEKIVEGLTQALETEPGRISVKAKTGEGVDAVGERRAVRATAVVLLEKVE